VRWAALAVLLTACSPPSYSMPTAEVCRLMKEEQDLDKLARFMGSRDTSTLGQVLACMAVEARNR